MKRWSAQLASALTERKRAARPPPNGQGPVRRTLVGQVCNLPALASWKLVPRRFPSRQRERLAAGPCPGRVPDIRGDTLRDEAHAAVCQQRVDAAGVEAAGRRDQLPPVAGAPAWAVGRQQVVVPAAPDIALGPGIAAVAPRGVPAARKTRGLPVLGQ